MNNLVKFQKSTLTTPAGKVYRGYNFTVCDLLFFVTKDENGLWTVCERATQDIFGWYNSRTSAVNNTLNQYYGRTGMNHAAIARTKKAVKNSMMDHLDRTAVINDIAVIDHYLAYIDLSDYQPGTRKIFSL